MGRRWIHIERFVLTALFVSFILYVSVTCGSLFLTTLLNALTLRAIGRLWGPDWATDGVSLVCPRGSNA